MSELWKPSIRIWPFKDAPEEFRRLHGEPDGSEQLVFFVPPEWAVAFENGDAVLFLPDALSFLGFPPKRPGLIQYAGDEIGDYRLILLPDGGRVAITGDFS